MRKRTTQKQEDQCLTRARDENTTTLSRRNYIVSSGFAKHQVGKGGHTSKMRSWDISSWGFKTCWGDSSCRPRSGSCDSISCKPQSSCDILSWRPRSKIALVSAICLAFTVFALVYTVHVTPSTFYEYLFSQKIRSFFGEAVPTQLQTPFEEILEKAAMPNKTVIITTVNGAWAKMMDLFLESFHHGDGIESLLSHLIIIALDETAFNRCIDIHPHCYKLKTRGVDFSGEKEFMSADYLKMMWRRIQFLRIVLEKGYSFIFTDADVLWFRNPFPHFLPDKDFQIACDEFNGHETDLHNLPNGGFVFVRANNRAVKFYKYWYNSQQSHPTHHDQDVLNDIKFEQGFTEIGLKIRFLDTQFFGGFCSIERSSLRKVTTMHANCCKGENAKIEDLRATLDDWKQYQSNNTKEPWNLNLRAPIACPKSWS